MSIERYDRTFPCGNVFHDRYRDRIARFFFFFFFSPNRSLNVSIRGIKSRTVRYSNIERDMQHIHVISLTATVLEQLTLDNKKGTNVSSPARTITCKLV